MTAAIHEYSVCEECVMKLFPQKLHTEHDIPQQLESDNFSPMVEKLLLDINVAF
jgi:hypothetical protein